MLGKLRDYGQDWLQRSFQALCRQHSFTLYHEPNYIPLACDLPTVATIHDLSMLLHPEWHPADRVRHFECHFEQGLKQCVHLLTVSEAVRAEIVTTLSVQPEIVSCVPNGIRPGLEPLPTEIVRRGLRRLRLPAQYLLCLGTLEPRKNVLMLMRVYCSLPEELRQRCPLLLVGGWGWNRQDIAAFLEEEARFRGVLHLGYLADRDLPILYNGARALVFPSFYEGFGLPPLEMLACGGAVLASTSAALVETVGGQAHLIDPHDVDGWRQGLLRAAHDDDWLASLRQGAVARARPFTWERCADQTWQVYRSVTRGGIDQHVRARADSDLRWWFRGLCFRLLLAHLAQFKTEAGGADTMTEGRFRMSADVLFHLEPVILVVADLLAPGTDGQHAAELLDLGQGVLELMDAVNQALLELQGANGHGETGRQLLFMKRLGQVIVGAAFEARGDVFRMVPPREQDQVRELVHGQPTHMPANIRTIHPSHLPIEQGQPGRGRFLESSARGVTVGDSQDIVAPAAQRFLHYKVA